MYKMATSSKSRANLSDSDDEEELFRREEAVGGKSTVLLVGYSPTGGGHTGRTLNIIDESLNQGTLAENDMVIFYVPPHWEGTKRPAQLSDIAGKLTARNIDVKFIESEKPVYGYLDKTTGGSDDARILERIALHPLRNTSPKGKYKFLANYFTKKPREASFENIEKFSSGSSQFNLDELPRMSAPQLIDSVAQVYGLGNIKILSDMDPALQKAARNAGIAESQRLDQQNHAILLNRSDREKNVSMDKAVLAKVLGGRGEHISHISLGGKNTLSGTSGILKNLNITGGETISSVKRKIMQLFLWHAHGIDDIESKFQKDGYSGVLKGNSIEKVEDIGKAIYIYAHKKTPIIASHIMERIRNNDADYKDKIFIFCGKNAVGSYNAMHLAYLVDADGITTSGAGTSGEFVYLHRVAGAKSTLLSLPIEGHNEQEAITDALLQDPSTRDYTLRLEAGETLNDGKKIDALVKRPQITAGNDVTTYQQFITALGDEQTYVGQAHNILFRQQSLDQETADFQDIQRIMYSNVNLKATRSYLKFIFQLFNILKLSRKGSPVVIRFKESGRELSLSNVESIREFINDDEKLKTAFGVSSSQKVQELPLLSEVRTMLNSDVDFSSEAGSQLFIRLKDKLGHHMTTGF